MLRCIDDAAARAAVAAGAQLVIVIKACQEPGSDSSHGANVQMMQFRFLPLAALAFALVASGCATTAGKPPKPQPTLAPGYQYVPERQRVPEPFAHVLFCTHAPSECSAPGRATAVTLTPAKMAELAEVNRDVNGRIVSRPDPGPDTWTLFPRYGDCDDYAVTKRHVLIARGWPASALRLAIGKTPAEEGHLVLVVRTGKGDLVLDNLSDDVVAWRDFNMSWLSIQSAAAPRIWHKVAPQELGSDLTI